jgi:hypothetical protein
MRLTDQALASKAITVITRESGLAGRRLNNDQQSLRRFKNQYKFPNATDFNSRGHQNTTNQDLRNC